MKVCKMGLESIWINHACGDVRICGWTNYVLGNLLENTIEELWHGKKAEKFRRSLQDGSYQFCKSDRCPYLANHTLDTVLTDYEVPNFPKYCSLSYEEQCNYVCKFCREKKYIPADGEQEQYKKIETEVNKFIGALDTLSTNGVGEIFCSPSTLNILGKVKLGENAKVQLESNGSLFNEKNWKKIDNIGAYNLEVIITVHSFDENTYQFLSGTTLPVDNIIQNLFFIKSLREKGIVNRFEIATVICERNFRQMPDFVKRSLEFEPDSIRLRFFEPYGVRNKSIEWFFDVRNPHHPYYEEFINVMSHPIFKEPKVWKWQGETLSDFKEHPYYEEQAKVKILSELFVEENIEKNLREYLKKHNIHRFALYGNGYVGQAFAALLDQKDIEFENILDTYALDQECFRKHNVLKPDACDLKEYDLIIITSAAEKEIKNVLANLGYEGEVILLNTLLQSIKSRCL